MVFGDGPSFHMIDLPSELCPVTTRRNCLDIAVFLSVEYSGDYVGRLAPMIEVSQILTTTRFVEL